MSRNLLQQEVLLLFVQPRKERQKEHSTDRQTQPRRQTGIVEVLYSLGLHIKRKTERTRHRQAETTKKTDG
jgi:hypothetical protein